MEEALEEALEDQGQVEEGAARGNAVEEEQRGEGGVLGRRTVPVAQIVGGAELGEAQESKEEELSYVQAGHRNVD